MKLVLMPRSGQRAPSRRASGRSASRGPGSFTTLMMLGVIVSFAVSSPARAAAPVTVTFSFSSGHSQFFNVPGQVTSLQITARGASGGSGYSDTSSETGGAGGPGSQITGTVAVTPGDVEQVFVGQGGGDGSPPDPACGFGAPSNPGGGGEGAGSDGGNGGHGGFCLGGNGGGGGGASDVAVIINGKYDDLTAAGGGGGGGAGGFVTYNGGAGGSGGSGGAGGDDGSGVDPGSGGARGGGGGGGSGSNGGDHCGGCSSGGGGGGGGGFDGGAGGNAGGAGAGGGGGGGAGTDHIPSWFQNAAVSTSPLGSGADGLVTITYTPPDQTTTTVSCSPASVLVGQPTRCTATVTDTETSSPSTPTGTVRFASSGAGEFSDSPCTLQGSGLSARCSVTYTPAAGNTGPHTITASYGGDNPAQGRHAPSIGTQAVSVSLRSASLQLNCSPVRVPFDKPSTCTATLTDTSPAASAITPSGPVTFKLNPLSRNMAGTFSNGGVCTPSGSGATAACSVTYTPTAVGGLHEIIAAYDGDEAHRGGLQNAAIVLANVSLGAPPPSSRPPHHHRHRRARHHRHHRHRQHGRR